MTKKKIALIVGGTGGIGQAISRSFVKNGIKVYATYLHNFDKAKKVLPKSQILKCDIRKKNDVKKAINYIIKKESRIDVVVNAVTSKLKLKTFEQLTSAEFLEDIQVILLGSINIYRYVVPIMKRHRSGTMITLLTSTIFDNPPIRMSSYVTAKFGLLGLTKSLAVELDRFNIRVIGIAPSFVQTGLLDAFPEKLIELEKEKQPDKKFIQPEDIAKLSLSVVENNMKYINGENIIVHTKEDIRERLL